MSATGGSPRAIRGGSWDNVGAQFLRSSYRLRVRPEFRGNYLGFRCVREDTVVLRTTRSGSWFDVSALDLRASARLMSRPGRQDDDLGFRCVREVNAARGGRGSSRAVRGGCWGNGSAWDLRASIRNKLRPEDQLYVLGFRCVREGSREPSKPPRVRRGGSWSSTTMRALRASHRYLDKPRYRGSFLGFRCVRTVGAAGSSGRAFRGGGWFSVVARSLRSSYRSGLRPEDRYDFLGFRCVREATEGSRKPFQLVRHVVDKLRRLK